jgi:hypothetical protein
MTALGAIALLAACSAQVKADIATFDFSTLPDGKATPFSMTDNGVTASFSSPTGDPGGFQVGKPAVFSFTDKTLFDPGPSGKSRIPLDIAFSKQVQSISMKFATAGPGLFELFAYNGSTPAGSTSASGSIPPGFGFPEGTLSFSGLFDKVALESPSTPFFAVADIVVTFGSVPTVPEPSSFLLAGTLGLGLGAGALWRHRKSA